MARPRNADGQRTRQAIIDAALDLFGEKGYFGTTLRDVAAAVGIRESAIYNYFRGKEALFLALISADQESRLEHLDAALESAGGDARVLLEQLATRLLDDFRAPRQQRVFRILMSDGIRLARAGRLNLVERMSAGRTRMRELMRRLVRDGVLRDADPDVLAMAFAAPLVMWRQMHAVDATQPAVRRPDRFVAQHVEQFLRGAAAPAPARRAATPGRRRAAPASARRPLTRTV
ncbi:MAG: TetR family transcriptional regulator [Vicinamibacterales bacterium]